MDRPTGITGSTAVVEILKMQEKRFIESANLLMNLGSNHHAGARYCVDRGWQNGQRV
jgi:hypothetical protein